MRKLMLMSPGGREVDVEFQRRDTSPAVSYQLRIDDRTIELDLQQLDDGHGWLHIQGRVVPFHVLRRNDDLDIWLKGRVYRLQRVDPAARAAHSGKRAPLEDLIAPMPGTVLKILVTPNQSLKAHAPLLVMESMKMEMTLSAAGAGRVKQIACREGDLVEMGALLIKLEAPPDDDAGS